MKEYKYDALAVELSRRCNLKCIHCGRGNAQDVTITPEIIDAIFENVEECPKWYLLGGEPLLATDMLEYFIDKLTRSDVGAKNFCLTTNGTILDSTLVPLLARFSESADDRSALIRISDDPFHDTEQSKRAHEFYSDQASKYKRIKIHFVFDEEIKQLQDNESFVHHVAPVLISGRASDNIEAVKELSKDGIHPTQVRNHRIRIDENTVKCWLAVWANGNVGFAEMQDYNTMDRLSIGNILCISMYEMITKHNADCLLSCRDLQQWEEMSAWRIPGYLMQEYPMMPFLNELVSRIGESVFEKILAAREEAHRKYTHIPTWRIIEAIPFPDFQYYGMDTVRKILDQFPPFELYDVLKNIDNDIIRRSTEAIKSLGNDPEKEALYNGTDSLIDALKCFGKLDEMRVSQSVIDALEPLNSQYEKEGKEAEEKNSACQETNSGAIESGSIKEIIRHSIRAARKRIYTEAGYELLKVSRGFVKKIMERG